MNNTITTSETSVICVSHTQTANPYNLDRYSRFPFRCQTAEIG